MLTITIPQSEMFDQRTNSFVQINEQKLTLEHSLVSLAKWESKWHKPFISKQPKTFQESVDYIRCMTITQNVNPDSYLGITRDLISKVNSYIDDPMTATWFNNKHSSPPSRQVVTAQLIYYWMISLQIPFQCQKWHLNRLLTLIHVCDVKNAPAKKMSKKDIMNQNRALNNSRRAKMNSRG